MTPTPAFPLPDPALAELLTSRLAVVEERLRDAVAHADVLADATARHLVERGRQAAAPAAHPARGPARRRAAARGASTPPSSSSSRTWPRCTTTTSWTARRCGAGRPPRTRSGATRWPSSPATCCSRARPASSPGSGPEAVRLQAATFERLCLGQLHETVGPQEGEDPVAHYLRVLSDKTGSLIATSARFGAMFAGCPPEVLRTVTSYGEKVGVAFQLADDVIDLSPDGARTGKTPGTDLRERVPTMPVLLLRAAGRVVGRGRRRPHPARAARRRPDRRRGPDRGGHRAARPPGRRRDPRARGDLGDATPWRSCGPLPAGAAKDALVAFADALVDRAS